ncbi:MAG: sensor histidine kinase [Spirochaetales bacterium]
MVNTSKILIVDDEKLVALAEQALLEEQGFVVESASNGETAVEMCLPGGFDAVLMDINLGAGIDGIEAARRIEAGRSTPVVFISSIADPQTLAEARAVSPYGFLQKGADGFAIEQALTTAIELHKRIGGASAPVSSAAEDESGRSDGAYLKHELYSLVQTNPAIFEFLEAGSLDGVWYWDVTDPSYEWMSPQFWMTFGYDPAEKRHLSSEWQDMIHPDDLQTALENFRRHLEDPNHPYDQIVRYRHRDGSTVWVRCRGLAIRDASGTPIRMLGAHNELTKQMESHQRQVALVKEMNHRVKNNLAVLEAMIQIERSETGKSREDSLEDIGARLRAIMLVHEQLYQSGESSDVNVRQYLQSLIDQFVQASSHVLRGHQIELDAPDLTMSAGRASKLGMIVSELLANSIKHAAAPDDGAKRISLALAVEQGTLVARYADYGPKPDGVTSIDDMKHGTGMTLIEALVGDLRGSIELLDSERRTTFEIVVPVCPVTV